MCFWTYTFAFIAKKWEEENGEVFEVFPRSLFGSLSEGSKREKGDEKEKKKKVI